MTNAFSITLRRSLAVGVAALLGACASAPKNHAALDEATTAYERAAGDARVARSAPVELRQAHQALQEAQAALRADEDKDAVAHFSYLAKQRTEIALQTDRITQAEEAIADASSQRDRILIEARTRDAQAQQSLAEKARVEAESQRARAEAQGAQAEAARTEAIAARKLAEERLAQATQSAELARAEQARTQALEKQLVALKAKETSRGMVLTLGDVLFDTGKAQLHAGASRTIDQLVAFLKENPERTIQIEGYTDSMGTPALNQSLSERRADAVKNALTDRGITAARLSSRGFGETNPVAGNDSAAGRQLNRRVEIVVSKKS